MLHRHHPGIIALSFGVAFVGSYLSLTTCEQYRQIRIGYVESRYLHPLSYLAIMSICLGGVGVWCMHFIGMSDLMVNFNGTERMIFRYNIGLTVLSLVVVLLCSILGFYIAAKDEVFMKNKRQIVELVVSGASSMTLQEIQHITPYQILRILGTHSPQHILCGGFVTGTGAVLMHYIGILALDFEGTITCDPGIVSASILIAFGASSVAFWVMFRLLSMYPSNEHVRIACALIMAVAVSGMHYVGMFAVHFHYDASMVVPMKTTMSAGEALLSGLLIATLVSLLVVILSLSDLRYSVIKLANELCRADEAMMNLPPAAAGQLRRYLKQRKASRFNLGIINKTMIFEADNEPSISSRASDDGSAAPTPWSPSGTGAVAIAHNKVHPAPSRSGSRTFDVDSYDVEQNRSRSSSFDVTNHLPNEPKAEFLGLPSLSSLPAH